MQNDDLKKQIGSKIKSERNKRGWTQVELANNTKNGITKTVISNIENGKTNPSIEYLNVICMALQIEVWELFVPSFEVLFSQNTTPNEALQRILSDSSLTITPEELGVLKMIPVDGIEKQSKTIYLLFLALLRMMNSSEFKDSY